MRFRVEGVVVDAHHEGGVDVGRGGGDDDPLGTGLDMCAGGLAVRETSRSTRSRRRCPGRPRGVPSDRAPGEDGDLAPSPPEEPVAVTATVAGEAAVRSSRTAAGGRSSSRDDKVVHGQRPRSPLRPRSAWPLLEVEEDRQVPPDPPEPVDSDANPHLDHLPSASHLAQRLRRGLQRPNDSRSHCRTPQTPSRPSKARSRPAPVAPRSCSLRAVLPS